MMDLSLLSPLMQPFIRECLCCHDQFIARTSWQKFCSPACRVKDWQGEKRKAS